MGTPIFGPWGPRQADISTAGTAPLLSRSSSDLAHSFNDEHLRRAGLFAVGIFLPPVRGRSRLCDELAEVQIGVSQVLERTRQAVRVEQRGLGISPRLCPILCPSPT